MRRIYSIIISFFCLIYFCACSKAVEYPFFEREKIESIQIVKAKNYIENEGFYHNANLEYEVVKEIEDIELFIQDFLSLDFYTVYNPSTSTPSGYYSVKFNYDNRVYELFDYCGYILYEPQGPLEVGVFIYCDSKEYFTLIEKWVGYTIDTKNIYEVRGIR